MKRIRHFFLSAVTLLVSVSFATTGVCAQPASESAVKKSIEKHLKDVKIESVTKTPYLDLYEVRVGSDIVYTDKSGQYLFVGHIFDPGTNKDLTRARLDDINKIDFKMLPVDDLAIKIVKGDGKRMYASFEDPNCGYCKRLARTFNEMNNYTLYIFPLPILSEDSINKVQNIWCSKNRAQAWMEWMDSGKNPVASQTDCKAPIDKLLELGRKLKVTGTPTIYLSNGKREVGAIDAKILEAEGKN